MSRHTICQAIVLHQHPIGEIHGELTLLTADHGLIRAMAPGIRGQKSSLRSKCQVYSLINAYLYEDRQKQRFRLSDAEVLADYFNLRENLASLYHAAAMAEIIKRTPLETGDNWAFSLYLLALESLSVGRAEASPAQISLQFLWRYLGFTGYQPDPKHCQASGTLLEADEAVRYQAALGGFVAVSTGQNRSTDQDHVEARKQDTIIPAGGLAYLRHSSRLDFTAACRIGLSHEARSSLLRLFYHLIEDLLGSRLTSLQGQEFLFFG